MLLRRITQNVQDQNWLAICIDFTVVVVGIFIGLQVDGWNDERKDRISETALLEQLYVDFTNNGEMVERLVEFHDDKVAEIDFAIDIITRGELLEKEQRRFMFAILSMYQLPPLGATMGSYDAVMASGDFALIRDQGLKSMLVQLSSDIKADASLLSYFRDNNQQDSSRTRHYATVEPNDERSNARLQVNFSAIMADPLALTIVAGKKRNHEFFGEGRRQLAEQFAATRAHIGGLLDKQEPVSQMD